ncbi:type III-A CRISPR-associated RAMP protein Csm4 [Methylomagnum sp.]
MLWAHFHEPLTTWLIHCEPPADIPGGSPHLHPQPHNTIDRLTGTTGDAAFAPYAMSQLWFGAKGGGPVSLDIYVALDDERLRPDELALLFQDMGAIGYGRDASIGLGKFRAAAPEPWEPPCQDGADAYLTLAPCAPQRGGFEANRSFYQVFTRFGRHGDIGVHAGNPFKSPVLLAQTGAVLTPREFRHRAFVGRGLGGDGSLSKSIPATVQQGYAPVVGVRLPAPETAP